MVKITLNSILLDQLAPIDRTLEICDPSGRTVGYFHPAPVHPAEEKSSARSPFSDEELQRRRQQRAGRPLAEILERLERT
jgi:hypothetical protein